jgi:hypothetical protein
MISVIWPPHRLARTLYRMSFQVPYMHSGSQYVHVQNYEHIHSQRFVADKVPLFCLAFTCICGDKEKRVKSPYLFFNGRRKRVSRLCSDIFRPLIHNLRFITSFVFHMGDSKTPSLLMVHSVGQQGWKHLKGNGHSPSEVLSRILPGGTDKIYEETSVRISFYHSIQLQFIFSFVYRPLCKS